MRRIAPFALALLLLLLMPLTLVAAPQSLDVHSPADAAETVQTNLNFVWVLVATMLVFLMQAGFALLETGFTRSKNAVNIIMKNVMDVSVGGLAFFAVGFGLMFGTGLFGIIGTSGFFLWGISDDPWTLSFFLFQAVFAATAATIVSGAVAERIKFSGYLILTVAITGLIYPVFGAWAWGGLFNGSGWLEALGFCAPGEAGAFVEGDVEVVDEAVAAGQDARADPEARAERVTGRHDPPFTLLYLLYLDRVVILVILRDQGAWGPRQVGCEIEALGTTTTSVPISTR